ncbi:MAG: metallophosphoesterase family protein, partial [Anaerolineales bacterium]
MLHFIHITDTHIGPDSSYMLYEQNTHANAQALVHLINHELPFRPALVLHTGDVMFNPGAPAAQLAAQVFGQLNVPIRYVCGNHDDRAQLREFVLGQNPSDAPIYYDFVLDDFHFLVLDTRGAVDPQGYIDAEQLVWLRETCAASKARSLVICVH